MPKKDNTPAVAPTDDVIVDPVIEPGTEPAPDLESMMTPVDEVEPGTEPEPPAEPAVEPEPQPVEPVAAEPPPAFDVKQDPEYQRMATENQQMKMVNDLALGDQEVYDLMDKKIRAKSQPQTQPTEPETLQIPVAPEYGNWEDLKDPNSETYKYMNERDRVVTQNATNAMMTAMDKKFAQNEQQSAEKARQNNLAQSLDRVAKTVDLDAETVNKAMDVFNNPNNYDLDTVMKSMILAGNEVLKGNVPQTPTPRPNTPPVTPQPIVKKTPSGLPNYSDVGGSPPEPNTETEDEFLNKDLMGSLAKEGRRYTNRK